MTLSCDAATDCLWPTGAPVKSDCWNGYSPSSSLSSQPCSPGTTGGLVGHAEKTFGELGAMPLATHGSFYGIKRIRLSSETNARAGVQAYTYFESGQPTSAQLACSTTPSPHASGVKFSQYQSGVPGNLCPQLSPVYVGVCAPSSNDTVQRTGEGPTSDIYNNLSVTLAPTDSGQVGNSNGPMTGQLTTLPFWQVHPQLQSTQPQLLSQQLLQQQHTTRLGHEQAAQACTTAISSLALTLTLCDMRSSSHPAPGCGLPATGLLQSCAPAVGGGCAPALGSFSLPFVFTGAAHVPLPLHAPPPALAPALTLPAPVPPVAAPQTVVHGLPTLPCSLPAVLLDTGLLMASKTRLAGVNVPALPPVMLSALHTTTSVPQLPAAQPLQPAASAPAPAPLPPPPASQLTTPFLSYLTEPARCTAPGTDLRVQLHVPTQAQGQSQCQAQQPPLLKARPPHLKRVRPPSQSPPSMPLTPPQPGSLGAEDWILHVVKVLGMSEPDTARLSLHCWRRVSELPQLHHATRLWSSTVAGRNLYATACVWVSIKLEEKRRAAPGGIVLAHMAATTPATLCSAELAVMNWLEWRPYNGYRLDESHLLVYM